MTNQMQKRKNDTVNPSVGNVVDSIFNNALSRFFDQNLWEMNGMAAHGSVRVNVRENANQYEVDVVAPGCRKEDFKIQVSNRELSISFEHDEQKNEKDEQAGWVRNEYMQQSFSRSFSLDDTVDAENISASYTDGILRIVLPKHEKAKPKNIEINVK
jgi:HSP20 family protein